MPELDGLRAFAILAVLALHTLVYLPIRFIPAISSYGYAGVDLFFVLSGFLITGILLEAKGSQS